MARVRLDVLLTERGLFPSRAAAAAAVLAGMVRVDGVAIVKAGHQVDPEANVEVSGGRRFVSRGGEKLARALELFPVDPTGMRCIDVGASTGGFTDCLLKAGAAHVVALDVGYGQLAWSLRTDPRVLVVERANIRTTSPGDVDGPFDLVVTDVSFISLTLVMPHLAAMVGADGDLIALIKPQFEVGKSKVGKRGVVREPALHAEAIRSALTAAEHEGLTVKGLAHSPVKGPEGNIEFLLWAARGPAASAVDVDAVVAVAHESLEG